MRLNDCDPGFKHEIAREPGGEGITTCFACAACSARCPVGAFKPEYDPRRLIRLAILGRREEVLSSPLIWLSTSHLKAKASRHTCGSKPVKCRKPSQVRYAILRFG